MRSAGIQSKVASVAVVPGSKVRDHESLKEIEKSIFSQAKEKGGGCQKAEGLE